ncbi:DUF4191 domain-containing protein [Nocardioides rotundus]|uniref:DUF4191 domain-containing protein n=1 Tax=Nocardioides rotundus TaxID=1774216 RepID=UPI001CBD0F5F|nr:DUF4191 domain-containing protein [Nocardioides rotundus]UAL31184.1 DUF4191 domain-containing protein [Nocardioides rotundus]
MARNAEPEKKQGRRAQLAQTYRAAKQTDPKIGLITFLAFLLGFLVGGLLFWLIPPRGGWLDWVLTAVGAIMLGLLAATMVFFRRAQRSMYSQIEGRTGAAASALQTLRRGWKTDPMVGFTKQQDLVHRVVGPPGVVLVGEGNPARLRQLMATERRKHERVLADTPVSEIIVGDGEGQVPLPKLSRHLMKMKRQVKPGEMTDILNRLKAIDAHRGNIPMPKGPVPTSMKGMRSQQRGR